MYTSRPHGRRVPIDWRCPSRQAEKVDCRFNVTDRQLSLVSWTVLVRECVLSDLKKAPHQGVKIRRRDTVKEAWCARDDQVRNIATRRLETSDGGFCESNVVSLCGNLEDLPCIERRFFAFLVAHRDSHTIQDVFLYSRCSKHIGELEQVCTEFDFDQYIGGWRWGEEVQKVPDYFRGVI
jgi:hypothetical protein